MRRLSTAVDLLQVLLGAFLGLATNYVAAGSHAPLFLRDVQRWSLPLVGISVFLLVGGRLWMISLERPRQPSDDWDPSQSPYPGLESFTENDASTFFGREAEIRTLYERLHLSTVGRPHRLVPVVGPSGCGKSSLVQAGLLPRLATRRGRWFVLPTMVPTEHPLRSLGAVLTRDAVGGVEALPEEIADSEKVEQYLKRAGGRAGGRAKSIVLVIDQAEELFTLCAEEERSSFLRLLARALDSNQSLWVILVMRTEFLSEFLVTDYGALVQQPFAIGPLGRTALFEVIERPAARAGLRFDPPGLINRMVDDTGGGEALPLLAYTLHELWEDAGGNKIITKRNYESIGGVAGALTRRANAVTDQLQESNDPDEPVLTTLIRFVSIVGPTPTRRRVRYDAFNASERQIVDAFVAARLLTIETDSAHGEAIVSITHEALIDRWAPLRQAVEARGADLQAQARLERWTAEWIDSGRDDDLLLRGERLRAAQQWLQSTHDVFDNMTSVYEYVQLSVGADRTTMIRLSQASAGRAWDSLSRAPELALNVAMTAIIEYADTPLAYEVLIAALAASHLEQTITVNSGAVVDAVWSSDGRLIAITSSDGSLDIWHPGERKPLRHVGMNDHPVLATVWALDGERLSITLANGSLLEWDVQHADAPTRLAGPATPATQAAWTYDRSVLALADEEGGITAWQTGTLERTAVMAASQGRLSNIAWSPDGRRLAGASAEWSVIIWDVAEGQVHVLIGHEGPVQAVTWSPDGSRLASASDDWSVRIWDTTSLTQMRVLQHADAVRGVAWSPDGLRLAYSGTDGAVVVWDSGDLGKSNSNSLMVLRGHDGPAYAVAWSPDRSHLASVSADGTARLWNARLNVLRHGRLARAVAWSPDNRLLAASSSNRSIQIWDAASGDAITRLGDPEGDVTHLAWSPDSQLLASVGRDRMVKIWRPSDGAQTRTLSGQSGQGQWVTWCPKGCCIACASIDCSVRIWRSADGEDLKVLRYESPVTWVGWSPDHTKLAVMPEDGTMRIVDYPDLADLASFRGHEGGTWAATWSADGQQIATGSYDRTIKIWDATRGSEVRVLRGHDDAVLGLAWSPIANGWLASVGRDWTVRVWDVVGAREIAILRGHEDSIWGVGWAPDGQRLATSSDDGVVRIWDVSISFKTALAEAQRLGLRPLSNEERRRFLLPSRADAFPHGARTP